MYSENLFMLQIVANGLAELNDKMVFVGGAVTELYADDSVTEDIRPTKDVDCTIELSSRLEFSKLEEDLRSKGFRNDISLDAPICRWIYSGIKVDIMPTDEKILGFSNKWYLEGIANKVTRVLKNETVIHVFPVEYFLAAKFEAHKNRGRNDLRQSHDFEDIIYVFDNKINLLQKIHEAKELLNNNLSIYVIIFAFYCFKKRSEITRYY